MMYYYTLQLATPNLDLLLQGVRATIPGYSSGG